MKNAIMLNQILTSKYESSYIFLSVFLKQKAIQENAETYMYEQEGKAKSVLRNLGAAT